MKIRILILGVLALFVGACSWHEQSDISTCRAALIAPPSGDANVSGK